MFDALCLRTAWRKAALYTISSAEKRIDMNLSRCENGHFYDREKYSSCPHCAQGAKREDSMTTVFTEDLNAGKGVTESFDAGVSPAPQGGGTGFQSQGGGAGDITETVSNDSQIPVAGNMAQTGNQLNFSGDPVSEVLDHQQQNGLYDQDNDHTVAYYDELFLQPAGSTHSAMASGVARITSPCTGWLIALGGEHIGQDFRLKAGKNFIGRDKDMDIVLNGDKSVSRNKHAILVYEPKAHLYLVQPGESSELVYLNNEVVLNPTKLAAYDMITVGEVNLLFMPLCGERFNWDEILLKK